MKRLNILIIVFVCLLCSASRCNKDDCHEAIAFANKSSKDVYVYHSGYGNYGIPDSTFFLPDELSSLDNNYLSSSNIVKSNEIKARAIRMGMGECLEPWLEETRGRLNVFVLDAEIYETVPRDTILKYRMVKTISPTLEEMERNDWTITFTGE